MNPKPDFLNACKALSEALQHIPEPILNQARQHNPWFEEANINKASEAWIDTLDTAQLQQWLQPYKLNTNPKKVAIIMAGNLPWVGLHDLLCVLASGNTPLCKLSSDDTILMKYAIEVMNRELEHPITCIERVNSADAVIATGSNNSAKIFETYFSKIPNIIRKNRTSVAVLTGHETPAELEKMGSDIFAYFGLGCRNISKIFVPEGYDFTHFFEAIFPYGNIVNHHKYANNYDYNKAIYLLGSEKFLDNNFLMVREDNKSLHSPLSVLFYETYPDLQSIKNLLVQLDEEIQCVASKINLEFPRQVGLGETQQPQLWDYADGVDTMAFLNSIDNITK